MLKSSKFFYSLSMLVIMLLSQLLTACGSQPTQPPAPAPQKVFSGDQMLRDSQVLGQIHNRWQEGKQMFDKGQALQRQGQGEIDQGQTLINEGQKIMQESEEGYKTIKQ